MSQSVAVVVSVDVEEDGWAPARGGATVENVRRLPELARLLHSHGARATYLATHAVLTDPAAAAVVAELAAGGDEAGAHLHPWNTPPAEDGAGEPETLLHRHPVELQRRKLAVLGEAYRAALGREPEVFRSGRCALGPATAGLLVEAGYRVDTSVIPYLRRPEAGEGVAFAGAPLEVYRLGRDLAPDPAGALAEVPITAAYSRWPQHVWHRVHSSLCGAVGTRLRLAGLAHRAGLVGRVALSPETESVGDMLALSRRLVERGSRLLHLYLHSTSLSPGRTPFTATEADVQRLLGSLGTYLERLGRVADLRFATVGEVARERAPAPSPGLWPDPS